MADRTRIEWTEASWNPVAGCTPVSPGCANCYALRMAHRLEAMGQEKYQGTTTKRNGKLAWTGWISLDGKTLNQPVRWKKPRTIFLCSMSDLFHERVPLNFIQEAFGGMRWTDWHTFQVLTKRPQRALNLAGTLPWPPNVWMGTSVENADYVHRIRTLVRIPARSRFLSLEPLLGPIPRLPLRGIDWVIVGGESGPGARHMDASWVRQIRDRCIDRGIPFFFKQWGEHDESGNRVGKKKAGRLLDGRTWDELPERRDGES